MAKTIPTQEVKTEQEIVDSTQKVIDEMEAELVETTTEKPADKEKKTKEPKINTNQIGTSVLAEMLGITPRDLRIFLRKHFRNMETEKGKTYVWEKDSKELQEVIDAYKAKKTEPKAPKASKESKSESTDKPAEQAAPVTVTPPTPIIDLEDIDLEDID